MSLFTKNEIRFLTDIISPESDSHFSTSESIQIFLKKHKNHITSLRNKINTVVEKNNLVELKEKIIGVFYIEIKTLQNKGTRSKSAKTHLTSRTLNQKTRKSLSNLANPEISGGVGRFGSTNALSTTIKVWKELIDSHGVFNGTLLMGCHVFASLILCGIFLDLIDYFEQPQETRVFQLNQTIRLPRDTFIEIISFIRSTMRFMAGIPNNNLIQSRRMNSPETTNRRMIMNSPETTNRHMNSPAINDYLDGYTEDEMGLNYPYEITRDPVIMNEPYNPNMEARENAKFINYALKNLKKAFKKVKNGMVRRR